MADIRKYFTSSRNKTESVTAKPSSSSKLRKRPIIESDSEDEKDKELNKKKKVQQKPSKKKNSAIISDSSDDDKESEKSRPQNSKPDTKEISSKKRQRSEIIDSSSEDASPSSKKRTVQKKLDKVDVKSKFFKETSVSAVFGDKPVRRDSTRLKEIQEKLKKTTKTVKNDIQITDEDFEAAVLQMDDVGSNWVDSNRNSKSDSTLQNGKTDKEKNTESPRKNKKSDAVEKESKKSPDKNKKSDAVEKESKKSPEKNKKSDAVEKESKKSPGINKKSEAVEKESKKSPEKNKKSDAVEKESKKSPGINKKSEAVEKESKKSPEKNKKSDAVEKESKKPPEKNNKSNVIEKEFKKNEKVVVREEPVSKSLSSKTTSGSSAKLSIKDKLKQFSALSTSSKQVVEEVNKKTPSPTKSTEKLLSMKLKCTPDSGYSSFSSNCDSQGSQNSSKSDMTSQSVVVTSSRVKEECNSSNPKTLVKREIPSNSKAITSSKLEDASSTQSVAVGDDMPWVEKYKPDSTKKIIGQQGDQSSMKKLTRWLNDWYKNNAGSKKPAYVPAGWNTDKTGSIHKAALLSGPPGVGKTTTVSLVCKELGFDVVEFNASDTRSKKLLEEEVSKLLTNTSITSLFGGDGCKYSVTKKHVLVMDEVDGMAGTEDRGGVQELIHLIKITKVPIICMCNDRSHPKIRSLVNYCFDLRFQRPRLEQIKGYMKSVCFKEKLNVSSDVLNNIITSSNQDVRLVLNHLSMLAADKNSELEASKKYVKLSPWDALRKMFSKEDHKNMSIHDKFDLFFYDYSIAPLFVQENYLSVKPLNTKTQSKLEKMQLYARAADCISIGDLVDKEIRSSSAWSLLPTQAIFASYAPGEILEGYCSGQIAFPSWLGKNSKTNKIDRLLQEIQIHTRLKISASKESVNLEYASFLRNHILQPLVKDGSDGAKTALERLHEYDLLREDLESLSEICSWTSSADPLSKIDSKVKSAFTRLYNKNPPVRPYSLSAPIKKKANDDSLEEENSEDDDDKDNEEPDAMIVVKKKQLNQSDTMSPSTSKTKAKNPKNTSTTNKKKKK
ncbi:replication factor C subunit 1 [Planococcus citri]|uniref:replication factor C subunit 1 n=1 Tax=Planococcus citri TaxID=170843 RepID=UPI0031F90F68